MALSVEQLNDLKQIVLAAGDLREESYDPKTRRYRLDEMEAAALALTILGHQAAVTDIAPLIGLSLHGEWNDIMEWAGDRTDRPPAATIPKGFVFPSHEPVLKEDERKAEEMAEVVKYTGGR